MHMIGKMSKHFIQTHHMQCLAERDTFQGIQCGIFTNPKPMALALSVLVTIEMLNAVNRLDHSDLYFIFLLRLIKRNVWRKKNYLIVWTVQYSRIPSLCQWL